MTRQEARDYLAQLEVTASVATGSGIDWYEAIMPIYRRIAAACAARQEVTFSFELSSPATDRGMFFWGRLSEEKGIVFLDVLVEALTDGEMIAYIVLPELRIAFRDSPRKFGNIMISRG